MIGIKADIYKESNLIYRYKELQNLILNLKRQQLQMSLILKVITMPS